MSLMFFVILFLLGVAPAILSFYGQFLSRNSKLSGDELMYRFTTRRILYKSSTGKKVDNL